MDKLVEIKRGLLSLSGSSFQATLSVAALPQPLNPVYNTKNYYWCYYVKLIRRTEPPVTVGPITVKCEPHRLRLLLYYCELN